MKTVLRYALSLLVVVFNIDGTKSAFAAAADETFVDVQIAVRKDKAQQLHTAITSDTARFAGCSFLLDGQQPRPGHSIFVDHFVPVPDDARKPYLVLYYHCEPAKTSHYALFSEKAVSFAQQELDYVVRLLFDTQRHQEANCPPQQCLLDGTFHHTAPSRPCKYAC